MKKVTEGFLCSFFTKVDIGYQLHSDSEDKHKGCKWLKSSRPRRSPAWGSSTQSYMLLLNGSANVSWCWGEILFLSLNKELVVSKSVQNDEDLLQMFIQPSEPQVNRQDQRRHQLLLDVTYEHDGGECDICLELWCRVSSSCCLLAVMESEAPHVWSHVHQRLRGCATRIWWSLWDQIRVYASYSFHLERVSGCFKSHLRCLHEDTVQIKKLRLFDYGKLWDKNSQSAQTCLGLNIRDNKHLNNLYPRTVLSVQEHLSLKINE